ncbi:sulfatase family protein [Candidatus Binatus sp.]|uniref:sulfatase family protein n=1 Tax=Candidatus Binatus sp. TaxID=2811406 RepID=UPI003C323DEA
MNDQPNIVFVMSDQHRYDVMGCAGDPIVKTPNMDRLAGEGVRFDRAYCQGPLCMPARASMLTERYVRDHGVFENGSQVGDGTPTFLQALRDAGYHTCEIGKMHLWPHGQVQEKNVSAMRDLLVSYGFDEPIETVGKLASRAHDTVYTDYLRDKGLLDRYREFIGRSRHVGNAKGAPSWQAAPCPLALEDYADVWHGARAAKWIEDYSRREPFFLWVGFPGPHDPWDAPTEALEQYEHAEIPRPRSFNPPAVPPSGPFNLMLNAFLAYSDSATMTEEGIAGMRRAYYANVTVIDTGLGRIVEALREKGILDNTWIVYTTDHGEMMGEHRMITKMVFYEPSVRVPMIVRPPRGVAARTVHEPVQLMDLAATFREIAGAAAIEQSAANSLMPAPAGNRAPAHLDAIPSENFGFAMFLADRYKLVVHEDTCEPGQLFDLLEDPTEDRNLCGDPNHAAIVDRLMKDHAQPFLATTPMRPHPTLVSRLALGVRRNPRPVA